MSEYQYYEFQAIDRPLTNKEIKELRAISTRAEITSSSFVNDYSWGNFKGDEDLWMEKYFDGFLYYANWGTHVLKLRIPSAFLNLESVQPYCNTEHLSARLSQDKIILDFLSNDESGKYWDVEDELRLSPFLSLRMDLSRGDLRCLYLAWLAGVQDKNDNEEYEEEEYNDDKLEPPVPPGLSELSPALILFAEFLRIDSDLIEAASKASLSLAESFTSNDVRKWLATFSSNDKETLLADTLEGFIKGDLTVALQLVHRFNKVWHAQLINDQNVKPRTVSELLKEAKCITQMRQQREAEQKAAKKAEQQQLKQKAREKRLNEIVGQEAVFWNQIELLVSEKKAKSYDKAVELLTDLYELALQKDPTDFLQKLNDLKQRHSTKSSFIERVRKLTSRK